MTGRHEAEATPSPGDRWAWLTPSRRRWLYGIALAIIALCTAYGLVSDQIGALWGNLAAAALLVAVDHTPGKDGEDAPDPG